MSTVPLTHNTFRTRELAMLIAVLCSTACGGGSASSNPTSGNPTTPSTPGNTCSVTQLESEMNSQFAQLLSDTDFSFGVERDDGRRYVYQRGSSRMQTSYESASTSKLVSAVIILRLVEQGYLKLEDKPQDRIATWPIAASSPLATMNLANLLSFTSGLTEEPLCVNAGFINFESCVNTIANTNASN